LLIVARPVSYKLGRHKLLSVTTEVPNKGIEQSLGLSVIVPTYNETENIRELIERIESSLKGYNFEIVVVDDSSLDGTAEIAEELSKAYGNVKVVKRPKKMGLASAVLEGVKVARHSFVAVMDADLQHPPELLPKLFEKAIGGYDLVIASRYVEGGRAKGWSFFRKLMSKGAVLLAHVLLPRARMVKDPTSGFFVFKKSVVEGVKFDATNYKLLLEILMRGKYGRVIEVPYVFGVRRRGRSKLGLREVLDYALLLLKLRVRTTMT